MRLLFWGRLRWYLNNLSRVISRESRNVLNQWSISPILGYFCNVVHIWVNAMKWLQVSLVSPIQKWFLTCWKQLFDSSFLVYNETCRDFSFFFMLNDKFICVIFLFYDFIVKFWMRVFGQPWIHLKLLSNDGMQIFMMLTF